MGLFDIFHKDRYTAEPVEMAPAKKRSRSVNDYIDQDQKFRVHQDLGTLRDAIDQAENIETRDREELHSIYRDLLLDPHLTSQWETRKMKTLEKQYRVVNASTGEIDDQRTELLKADWFWKYIHLVLDSRLWGFTLIEFGPWDGQKFVGINNRDAVMSVDRDHVKPEFGLIVKNSAIPDGIEWENSPFARWLIFVGSRTEFGLLMQAAPHVLMKANVTRSWSEFAEVFGMPPRIARTTKRGDQAKKLFKALRDMGKGGFGIFDESDQIEFPQIQRPDAYNVYREFEKMANEAVSRLIFGQIVTSQDPGVVKGTAGEAIANMYGSADSIFVERSVNGKLFPLMTNLGMSMSGYRFEWDQTEKLGLKDMSEVHANLSTMGHKIDPEYIEETYNVRLQEPEVMPTDPNNPENVHNAIAEAYAGSRG